MVLDALREKSMDMSVGGCLKRNMFSRRQRKRGKVTVGPGLKECIAGHETSNFGELRVRWRGPWALKGGAQHERAKAGVANRTWSPEDREREGK